MKVLPELKGVGGGSVWVERVVGEERGSGWSLPSSLSPTINWCRNILDGQGHSPLVEGQLGFTLERREIMASLGKRQEVIWRGCSLLSLHWGHGPSLPLGRAEYINFLTRYSQWPRWVQFINLVGVAL